MDEKAPANCGRGFFHGQGPGRIPMGWVNRIVVAGPDVSVMMYSRPDGVHFPISPLQSAIAVRALLDVRSSLKIR